ncbi:hypothetical protein BVY03_03350 [bacterium K02(2017)]|nr:hypothetical protein BVY03_03350 [bacterium K02(2017)]
MNNNPSFKIIGIKDYNLHKNDDGSLKLTVELPDVSTVTQVNYSDKLKELNKNELKWVSGGGCYVINKDWVPLVLRSADSPSNANKLTISSGRSDTQEEWKNPKLVIRELFEEIVLLNNLNQVLVPQLPEDFENLDIHQTIIDCLKLAGIEFNGDVRVPTNFIQDLQVDEVVVQSKQKNLSTCKTLLHFDGNSGEVNLIYALSLDVDSIQNLKFVDTECIEENNRQVALRRPIYLYQISTQKIYLYELDWYKKLNAVDNELTPHANYTLSKLLETVFK